MIYQEEKRINRASQCKRYYKKEYGKPPDRMVRYSLVCASQCKRYYEKSNDGHRIVRSGFTSLQFNESDKNLRTCMEIQNLGRKKMIQ